MGAKTSSGWGDSGTLNGEEGGGGEKKENKIGMAYAVWHAIGFLF